MGINNLGQLVGLSWDGHTEQGFLDTGGSFTSIDVPGEANAYARSRD